MLHSWREQGLATGIMHNDLAAQHCPHGLYLENLNIGWALPVFSEFRQNYLIGHDLRRPEAPWLFTRCVPAPYGPS